MSYNSNTKMIEDTNNPNPNSDGCSVYDVQLALGDGTAISENRVSALCSDLDDNGNTITRINKWARYKPERINNVPPATLIHRLPNIVRKQNKYSLEIPYCNANNDGWRDDMMNKPAYDILNGDYNAWEYLRPRGNYSASIRELYRISDFVRLGTDSDDHSPITQTGYNHNAKIPFYVSINHSQVSGLIHHESKGFDYYQVNSQEVQQLAFTLYDNTDNDLSLADFIDIDSNNNQGGTDNYAAWRLILQVLDDDPIYSGATHQSEEWYERDTLNNDLQYIGDPLTVNSSNKVQGSVVLDVNDILPTGSSSGTLKYYHVLVGIGYCKKDDTSWRVPDGLFIPPYTETYPFHYIVNPVEHEDRRLSVIKLWYLRSGTTWTEATYNDGGINIPKSYIQNSSQIRLQLKVTNPHSQKFQFMKESDETSYTGYSMFKVQAFEYINGSSTQYNPYLEPRTGSGSWPSPTSPDPISYPQLFVEDSESEDTLYATMNVSSNIRNYTYITYYFKAHTGGINPEDLGSFTITLT